MPVPAVVTATANSYCIFALKKAGIIGVGQSALAEDINDTFTELNDMLSQWQNERWKIWHLVETKIIANGKGGDSNPYFVGPGGDINMVRPDRVEKAFNRQINPANPNQIDYDLTEMQSYEDWAYVALKTLVSFPSYYFYDAAMPLGKLYIWPVPTPAIYEPHIITKEVLNRFSALNIPSTLPLSYDAAIKWSLARRTRANYRKPKDEEINALARGAINVLRKSNTTIPALRQPDDLTRPGVFNIFSDQIR